MKILKIAVPAGIGDSLWVMTKMQSLLKMSHYDKISVSVCNDPLHRAEEFLKSFDFVSDVNYNNWEVTQSPHVLPNGCYNYGQCQPNWHDEFDWFFQANSYLEHGGRLENWLPELSINWNLMESFVWRQEELDYSEQLENSLGKYCVFYLGPESGNTTNGHNRGPLWSPDNWFELYQECVKLGLVVVVVGATYDKSYHDNYFTRFPFFKDTWYNYIGRWNIQRTLAVIKRSKFIIGYQSGIPITAAYMGISGGAFWRPHHYSISPDVYISFSENMSSGWVNPQMLLSNKWMPLIYTKHLPKDIVNHAKKYWL